MNDNFDVDGGKSLLSYSDDDADFKGRPSGLRNFLSKNSCTEDMS